MDNVNVAKSWLQKQAKYIDNKHLTIEERMKMLKDIPEAEVIILTYFYKSSSWHLRGV